MWEVDNDTPFAAERGWVRDHNGAEVWLVAVKCTFDIGPDGSTRISDQQPPVLRAPEYHGEPGASSVKYPEDLVLKKLTTDVILVGHAYAPGGNPVTELDVGFQVGPVRKTLWVSGDRRWTATGQSRAVPFATMPLQYERSYGGRDSKSPHPERDWDWRNPVGTGFAVTQENLTGVPLPNIEYPNDRVESWNSRPRPAGFGAIDHHWKQRAALAGTYDERWFQDRQPLLPTDFNDRYFQVAPDDQQSPAFLRGGEPVALYRLTPIRDELRFELPRVYLGFETQFYDGSEEIHRDRRLHTVILEPDFPRVSLVWHTALPCHSKVSRLATTVITLKTELATPFTPHDAP